MNTDDEMCILGSVIQSPIAYPSLVSLLDEDFQSLRHRLIAAVLRDMIRKQAEISVATLGAEMRARGKLDSNGGSNYLIGLVEAAQSPASAGWFADQIRKATRVRSALAASEGFADALKREDASAELDALLTAHRAKLDAIPDVLSDGEDDERDTVASLVREYFGPEQWLVPGLLTRGERVVVTGAEGLAKTTLMRQFAVCLAGGLNLWSGQRVSDGHRVLYLDAENSRMQSHNAYRWIGARASRPMIAPGWADRIVHKTRNDGLDLPGRDAGWFHQQAAQHSPDVIILGPAYKLMRGDPQKDSDVLALLQIIDEVRVKHDAAIFVETHSPHGQGGDRPVRPYGSSVWLRWPEVGFGIRQGPDTEMTPENRPVELEVVAWRGQREYRDWPTKIEHGTKSNLPWVAMRHPQWRPSFDADYSIPENEMGAA